MNINIDIRWYQWLFGLISVALLVLLVHDGIATFTEEEPQALGTIALLVGGALVISLYLTLGLRWTIKQFSNR